MLLPKSFLLHKLHPSPLALWPLGSGVPYGWHSVINAMQTQVRITTSLQCKDGHRLDIRTTMDPTEFQLDIYRRLKMKSRPLSRVIYKHGAPNRSAETQKV
jgi:hypothetical protein